MAESSTFQTINITMANGKPKYSNVIIIDDSDMDNMLNKMIMEVVNYAKNITIFSCPGEALTFLTKSKDVPDVIFLDINMPQMDGFEFMRKFEKLPFRISGFAKVIIISSSDDPIDLEKATQYKSIVKYLKKPLNKSDLS